MRKKQQNNIKIKVKRKKLNNKVDNNNYISESLIVFSFGFLLILSWLSIKWLYEYQYIFTIHRYINKNISIYFPIQISSTFLYIINFIILIILTIACNYFIIITIINSFNKYKNISSFYKINKFIFIPIFSNSFLFLLGKIIYKNYHIRIYLYTIGLILCLISLFSLLKISIEEIYIRDYSKIINENNFVKTFIEKYFFEVLLGLDLYYLFYVLCQIIYYFTYNLETIYFLGIVANLFFGIVSLYIIFNLRSFTLPLIIGIIYSGFLHFQYSIRPEERKEINLGNGEKILGIMFLFFIFVEIFFVKIG